LSVQQSQDFINKSEWQLKFKKKKKKKNPQNFDTEIVEDK